jgi:hypothetical protein
MSSRPPATTMARRLSGGSLPPSLSLPTTHRPAQRTDRNASEASFPSPSPSRPFILKNRFYRESPRRGAGTRPKSITARADCRGDRMRQLAGVGDEAALVSLQRKIAEIPDQNFVAKSEGKTDAPHLLEGPPGGRQWARSAPGRPRDPPGGAEAGRLLQHT